jgi:hypothetical protein
MQRLGDPNQAIYQSDVKQEMLWSPSDPFLPFSDSLRYGATIAKVLDTVRVDRSLTLQPNPSQNSLPPHIIVFDPGMETSVLSEFATLIREHDLHAVPNHNFNAVGWVGKDKTAEGKACLRTYNDDYQNHHSTRSRWFSTLLSYTHAMDLSMREDPSNASALADIALASIVRALRAAHLINPQTQRPFTRSTLRTHLRQTNEQLHSSLRLALAKWVLAFRRNELDAQQLRDAISAYVRQRLATADANDLPAFLDSADVDFDSPQQGCTNVFISDAGDSIKVGTVHSVKGETHTATLYLETFNYTLDSARILDFCLGQYPAADSKKVRHRENLKVAHVAFSRPTHLLAFACCSEHVAAHEAELIDAGWVVRKITKEQAA